MRIMGIYKTDCVNSHMQSVSDSLMSRGDNVKDYTIELDLEKEYQVIEGFGGAFNELGGTALHSLSEEARRKLVESLFSSDKGCALTLCRAPIGASDFALDAYSLNDNKDDYEMEGFSISRDKKALIPFILDALQMNPLLKIWSCPWSPPYWMKTNGSMCNGGELLDCHEVLKAYARYFCLYIQNYEKEGIPIYGVCVQNETDVINKYPTSFMSEHMMTKFLRAYLIPAFMESGIKTEIWVGTIRSMEQYASNVLNDPIIRNFSKGIGYQYSKDYILSESSKKWKGIKIIHTESPCHNGENSWGQAREIFDDIVMYLENGSFNYCYWNMLLDETGLSTWGWRQNSLITIDTTNSEVIYNYEYYILQHFSRFVRPYAKRIESRGNFPHKHIAFRNENGNLALVVSNFSDRKEAVSICIGGVQFFVSLDADSVYSILIGTKH